ncbi:MAG: flagellar hook-length control protein FliK [Oscillospiraceae bacterium]
MMMNTVMFDLQAAVMAAEAYGNGGFNEISGDGTSFSEVLAAQTVQTDQKEMVSGDAEMQTEEAEAIEVTEANSVFADILKQIEDADDGIKKAMRLLLKTVIDAFKGSDDGTERKTDMFNILFDGNALFDGEDSGFFLTGAEIMSNAGIMLEAELSADKNADDILAELEKFVSAVFDGEDNDTDENTAADVLAAMLSVPAQDISYLTDEEKAEAVEGAVKILDAPKQAVVSEMPEKLPEMEKLYSELKAAVKQDVSESTPNIIKVSFAALKINNAAEQVKFIGGTEEVVPELAAVGVQPDIVPESGVEIVETIDVTTAGSVEFQITEAVTEKLADIKGDDGTEELVMILKPENLGQVAVKLVKENGAVTVMLSAQYDEVGKLMTERAAALGSSLESRNYEVKDVQIVAPGNAAEQMGLNFTNQGFGFMRQQGQDRDFSDGNGSYRGIDAIDEAAETDAVSGDIKIREAKLWTTA